MNNWNGNRNQRRPVRVVSLKERAALAGKMEQEYPGYLEENTKLTAIVRILTGLRVLYAVFYLVMTYLYEIQAGQGWMNLFGAFFFFLWYSLMLRSGKFVAVAMLVFRGISISLAGPSILEMSPYLPLPLIFTLVLSAVMEFIEAVFCIYVLFNGFAAQTIRLNRVLDQQLAVGVSGETLEKMAEYQNPYTGENGGEGESGRQDSGREEKPREEKPRDEKPREELREEEPREEEP